MSYNIAHPSIYLLHRLSSPQCYVPGIPLLPSFQLALARASSPRTWSHRCDFTRLVRQISRTSLETYMDRRWPSLRKSSRWPSRRLLFAVSKRFVVVVVVVVHRGLARKELSSRDTASTVTPRKSCPRRPPRHLSIHFQLERCDATRRPKLSTGTSSYIRSMAAINKRPVRFLCSPNLLQIFPLLSV